MLTSTDCWPRRRLWTREEYHRAADVGLFRPTERLELLDGVVIEKVSPQNRSHAWSVSQVAEAMRSAFGVGFHVREEKPLVLADDSEPEPDVVVVRGSLRETPDHPTPANAVLVIEVSDTTLAFDQGQKASIYAHAGIDDYWLLDLRSRRLEVRRNPGLTGSAEVGYRSLQIMTAEGEVSPLAMPGAVIQVADLLPSQQAGE